MSADEERKKRVAIICVYSFLLVSMVVAVAVGITTDLKNESAEEEEDVNDGNKAHVSTSGMKAIESLCQPTDYQKECVDSLKGEGGNVTSTRELIKIAFNFTVEKIIEGLKKTQLLQDVETEPRAKTALDSCRELLEDSIDDLRRSIGKVGDFDAENFHDLIMDLKVWLSSTITYQDTCLDGFQNTTSEAGQKMKEVLELAMHLSSNGLAIIDELAISFNKLNITEYHRGRRLLNVLGHGEVPSWIGGGLRRKLLVEETPGLGKEKADVVVAKDGSGKFKSINEALKKVPIKSNKPFIIYVKEGIYNEYVTIQKNMTNIIMIGDGEKKTRITGNKNFIDGLNTLKTATFVVEGEYFMAMNIGFENSAGPEKQQAVALRVGADMSLFYNCSMAGYQDTLYAHTKRQFYRDCTISGTSDFVFGDSLSVFQNCTFMVRKPMENQQCIVMAQGRKDRHEPTGIIIQGGSIVSDPTFDSAELTNKVYLARPWKPYSRAIIMDAFIGDLITPEGYLPWQINKTWMDTCFYSEYNNRGPGSNKSERVEWPGVKTITAEHALDFTPLRFYKGDGWIKRTGIPYSPATMPSDSKSDPASKSDSDTGSDSKPDFDSNMTGFHDKSKSKSKSKPDSHSHSKSDSNTLYKSKSKSKSESDSKPDNKHQSKSESSTSKSHSNSESKSKPDSVSHSKSDSNTLSKSKSKSKSESDSKPDNKHQSKSESSNSKSHSNSESKSKAKSDSYTKLNSNRKSKYHSKSKPSSDSKPKSHGESKSHHISNSKPVSKSINPSWAPTLKSKQDSNSHSK